jgi:hypothetical protein
MANMEITAATPKMIPKDVNKALNRLLLSASKPILKLIKNRSILVAYGFLTSGIPFGTTALTTRLAF